MACGVHCYAAAFSAAACIQPSTPSLYRAGASSHLLRLAKFHTITTAVATAFDAVTAKADAPRAAVHAAITT